MQTAFTYNLTWYFQISKDYHHSALASNKMKRFLRARMFSKVHFIYLSPRYKSMGNNKQNNANVLEALGLRYRLGTTSEAMARKIVSLRRGKLHIFNNIKFHARMAANALMKKLFCRNYNILPIKYGNFTRFHSHLWDWSWSHQHFSPWSNNKSAASGNTGLLRYWDSK